MCRKFHNSGIRNAPSLHASEYTSYLRNSKLTIHMQIFHAHQGVKWPTCCVNLFATRFTAWLQFTAIIVSSRDTSTPSTVAYIIPRNLWVITQTIPRTALRLVFSIDVLVRAKIIPCWTQPDYSDSVSVEVSVVLCQILLVQSHVATCS